jgi:hypothetical protein
MPNSDVPHLDAVAEDMRLSATVPWADPDILCYYW